MDAAAKSGGSTDIDGADSGMVEELVIACVKDPKQDSLTVRALEQVKMVPAADPRVDSAKSAPIDAEWGFNGPKTPRIPAKFGILPDGRMERRCSRSTIHFDRHHRSRPLRTW